MKVLHVSGATSWGGNEQQLLYLVEELNSYGVEQFLFCYENTPLIEKIKDQNIAIISIPNIKSRKKAYRKLLNSAVKEHQFDLLHLHTSNAVTGYMITDLFYGLKVKAVFSKKGIGSSVSFLSKLKYNYKNIHKVLCVSEIVSDYFKGVLYAKNHHKLCVVYDGVKVHKENNEMTSSYDLRKELNIEKDTKIIGNIANHTKAKDLKTLIKTLDILVNKENTTDIHLVQIGEFSKRSQELKDMVSEYGLHDYISFVGFKNEASSILPQFDVYLMTSEREGGPTTVLEAFYKKVPVVSTNVGLVSEAIEDGVNGYVAPISDYRVLGEKVLQLLNDDVLRNSFVKISYNKFVNSYTAKHLGMNTFNVYKEIV
ncbi:glycosyltransferase [Aquimarina mytili]|uniref:Glycosyltransferase n=1 Tax=Aquimarina mytili TaxID=874423 RepID=A0A937D710_9FLAO|nr:glycosyltransferase [Aquimarina mytili]MBL0685014.1 glycosyltransferase [Aquimarina mytili]